MVFTIQHPHLAQKDRSVHCQTFLHAWEVKTEHIPIQHKQRPAIFSLDTQCGVKWTTVNVHSPTTPPTIRVMGLFAHMGLHVLDLQNNLVFATSTKELDERVHLTKACFQNGLRYPGSTLYRRSRLCATPACLQLENRQTNWIQALHNMLKLQRSINLTMPDKGCTRTDHINAPLSLNNQRWHSHLVGTGERRLYILSVTCLQGSLDATYQADIDHGENPAEPSSNDNIGWTSADLAAQEHWYTYIKDHT